MVRDFGHKLRITAALLGCASQKDLCARFRAVNPGTAFELERSYKWMQGRALPRSGQVYEDWATLLGTGESATRLLSCAVEEFLDLICACHEVSREALLSGAAALGGAGGVASAAAPPDALFGRHLAGAYACYSHAWSPYFEGRIIRGSLSIGAAAEEPSLMATYVERVSLGRIQASGPVTMVNRSIYLDLMDAGEEFRLSMCLLPPATLANVLAGVMLGSTLMDAAPHPAATRIMMIRIPADDALRLEDSNRDLDLAEESLARDLGALGVPAAAPDELDELLQGFLYGDHARACTKVDATAYAQLVLAIDRLVMATDPVAGVWPSAGPARRAARDRMRLVRA